MFTSSQAKAVFDESFAVPARAVLAGADSAKSAAAVYNDLGKLWASTRRLLESMTGEHAHKPAEDRSIADDVADAVADKLDALHAEIQPKAAGASGVLRKRWGSSVRSAMETSYKMIRAGEAADKSAFEVHSNPPRLPVPINTPAKPVPEVAEPPAAGGVGPATTMADIPLVGQLLRHRMAMTGGATGQAADAGGVVQGSGNVAAPGPAAGPVSPSLAQAAGHILNPGPPPLRVDQTHGEIFQHMCCEALTLTRWVDAQGLKGDQGAREAQTIARAVELATAEFGLTYLTSKAGEVQARRLIALVLHAKIGNWDFAELVEELPGSHATSCMPRSLLRSMQEEWKVISKIPKK